MRRRSRRQSTKRRETPSPPNSWLRTELRSCGSTRFGTTGPNESCTGWKKRGGMYRYQSGEQLVAGPSPATKRTRPLKLVPTCCASDARSAWRSITNATKSMGVQCGVGESSNASKNPLQAQDQVSGRLHPKSCRELRLRCIGWRAGMV